VEHAQIHDWEEVQEEYFDPKNDPWLMLVVPILKLMKRDELAKAAGIGPRSIQALRNGRWKPSKKTRAALTRAAGNHGRLKLGRNIRDDLCACAALRDHLCACATFSHENIRDTASLKHWFH
jgi:DNA-binding XRE family transcriptional regulator